MSVSQPKATQLVHICKKILNLTLDWRYFDFYIKDAPLTLSFCAKAEAKDQFKKKFDKKFLHRYKMPSRVIMVGAKPTIVDVEIKFFAEMEVSYSGKAELDFKFTRTDFLTAGITCERGDCDKLWNHHAKNKLTYRIYSDISGYVDLTVYPVLTVTVDRVAGPFVELRPYLTPQIAIVGEAKHDSEPTYYWNAKADVRMEATVGLQSLMRNWLGEWINKNVNYTFKTRPYTVYRIPHLAEKDVTTDGQQGSPGSFLGRPVTVIVKDVIGNTVPGVPVYFEVKSGGGALGSELKKRIMVITDRNGRAQADWSLGMERDHRVAAWVLIPPQPGVLLQDTLYFHAGAEPRSQGLYYFAKVQGNAQFGAGGKELPAPVHLFVYERATGRAAKNIPVEIVLPDGNGSVTPLSPVSDETGKVILNWTLGNAEQCYQYFYARIPSSLDKNNERTVAEIFANTYIPDNTPHKIEIISGNNQTGVFMHALPQVVDVKVTDAKGRPVLNQWVSSKNIGARTDKDGIARFYYILAYPFEGKFTGPGNYVIQKLSIRNNNYENILTTDLNAFISGVSCENVCKLIPKFRNRDKNEFYFKFKGQPVYPRKVTLADGTTGFQYKAQYTLSVDGRLLQQGDEPIYKAFNELSGCYTLTKFEESQRNHYTVLSPGNHTASVQFENGCRTSVVFNVPDLVCEKGSIRLRALAEPGKMTAKVAVDVSRNPDKKPVDIDFAPVAEEPDWTALVSNGNVETDTARGLEQGQRYFVRMRVRCSGSSFSEYVTEEIRIPFFCPPAETQERTVHPDGIDIRTAWYTPSCKSEKYSFFYYETAKTDKYPDEPQAVSSERVAQIRNLLPGTWYRMKIVRDCGCQNGLARPAEFTFRTLDEPDTWSNCPMPDRNTIRLRNRSSNSVLIKWKSDKDVPFYLVTTYVKDDESDKKIDTVVNKPFPNGFIEMQRNELTPGSDYVLVIQSLCDKRGKPSRPVSTTFQTPGNSFTFRCPQPANLNITNLTAGSAYFEWEVKDKREVLPTLLPEYQIRYRKKGTPQYSSPVHIPYHPDQDQTPNRAFELTGLEPCTEYEALFETACNPEPDITVSNKPQMREFKTLPLKYPCNSCEFKGKFIDTVFIRGSKERADVKVGFKRKHLKKVMDLESNKLIDVWASLEPLTGKYTSGMWSTMHHIPIEFYNWAGPYTNGYISLWDADENSTDEDVIGFSFSPVYNGKYYFSLSTWEVDTKLNRCYMDSVLIIVDNPIPSCDVVKKLGSQFWSRKNTVEIAYPEPRYDEYTGFISDNFFTQNITPEQKPFAEAGVTYVHSITDDITGCVQVNTITVPSYQPCSVREFHVRFLSITSNQAFIKWTPRVTGMDPEKSRIIVYRANDLKQMGWYSFMPDFTATLLENGEPNTRYLFRVIPSDSNYNYCDAPGQTIYFTTQP